MTFISVVIPVYNSSDTLAELHSRLRETLDTLQVSYELIFVDDFSVDNSWQILSSIKNTYSSDIKLVRLARNYGQHSATFCGFQYANGDYIITIDDDLQNDPEDILLLIHKQKETQASLVYGTSKKKHSFWRKLGSYVVRLGSRKMENGPSEGTSFRIMKKGLVEQLLGHNRQFIFLDEVLYWYTNEVAFASVAHHKRPSGKSGYSLGKLIKMVARSTLFYSTWPLKVMTIGGLLLSLVSFLIGLNFVVLRIFYDIPVQGFTALIVTILFSTSLVLLCFGILGSYIKHIFTVLNNKPMFSIAEKQL